MNPVASSPIKLLGLSLVDLTAHIQRAGFPAFRAKQMFHWLYQHGVEDMDGMHNLPVDLKAWLDTNAVIGGVRLRKTVEAPDGSRKLLWDLWDGQRIEGVLMAEEKQSTLCVSSQVGCALGCRFCVTGSGGFRRDCAVDEILGQIILARKLADSIGRPISNLVFMGMGEPLLNLEALIPALQLAISPQALKIPSRRITVSTAGLPKGIAALAEADLNVKLAVSLNAVDDDLRQQLMPIARKHPLPELLAACRAFQGQSPKRHRITFEYVMLAGVNDSDLDARRLGKLLADIPCKINLIPYNPSPDLPYERPTDQRIEAFRAYLDRIFTVAVRYSKGREVSAACGQLALKDHL